MQLPTPDIVARKVLSRDFKKSSKLPRSIGLVVFRAVDYLVVYAELINRGEHEAVLRPPNALVLEMHTHKRNYPSRAASLTLELLDFFDAVFTDIHTLDRDATAKAV